MSSLLLLGHLTWNQRTQVRVPASQDGEAEVERLIKQADDLKAEKQRLMSEIVQTQRQVSCHALLHSMLAVLPF